MHLATEMREEPEEERDRGAEYETGDDWKIKGGVFAAMDDVARKAAKVEGQFATKAEKSTGEEKKASKQEESATEFANGVHNRILLQAADRPFPGSIGSDEFEAGEEIANFEGGGFWGVGAVSAIVADAGAEVVANGPGCGFLGVSGTHGVAPLEDGAFGFENHGENFAGTHEIG